MKRSLVVLGVPGLVAAMLSGCALIPNPVPASIPTSWVGGESTNSMYLNWVEKDGVVTGTAQVAQAAPGATGDPISSQTVPATGTIGGGKITLNFGGAILGTTVSGTISASELSLEFSSSSGSNSVNFRPAGVETYNAAVAQIRSDVVAQRTATAQQQGVQDLATAIAGVNDARTTAAGATQAVADAVATFDAATDAQNAAAEAALATGCSNNAESDTAHDRYQDTLTTGDKLSSALFDLNFSVSALDSSVARLDSADSPPNVSERQTARDEAMTVLAAAQQVLSDSTDHYHADDQTASASNNAVYAQTYCM